MKLLFLLVFAGLFAKTWSPDWCEQAYLKTLSEKKILEMAAGTYQSEFLLMGRSEPDTIDNYVLELSDQGNMQISVYKDSKKSKLIPLYEYNMQLKNKEGILTVTTDLIKQNKEEFSILSSNIFKGIFYISKDRKELMFGNDIESDGGPASIWKRIKK